MKVNSFGFSVFIVRERAARIGRNLEIGEKILISLATISFFVQEKV
ncbi:HU family DNA-binding protein [Candidatus Hartigia pinicola]